MKKRILLLLACLWIIISFLLIFTTYAKYISSLSATTGVDVSAWTVVVNETNIIENNNFSSNLTLQFPETDYQLGDVIVPGAIGYFDLTIDTSQVSIPYKYTVSVAPDVSNEIADIKVIGFSTNGNNEQITYLDEQNNQIFNTVSPSSVSSAIRVYVKWFDDNTETLNDYADTNIALDGGSAIIQATLTFEQILESTTPTTNP